MLASPGSMAIASTPSAMRWRRRAFLSSPRASIEELLLCRPRFRFPDRAARPPNQAEAEALGPGLTTIYGDAQDLALDVELPSGEVLGIDDPALLRTLGESSQRPDRLTLLRSDRALTDCRPLSLFSLQTAAQLGQEVGATVDKRRFRANLYLDLLDGSRASPRTGSSASG